MLIIDWFDIENIDHLHAYRHLETTGSWPEGFVPNHVELDGPWQVAIIAKMARKYLESRMGQ